MHPRTLSIALLLAFAAVGCDLAGPEPEGAAAHTAPQSPAPQPPVRPNPSVISANVWVGWEEAQTATFLDRAQAVNIGGVRVAGKDNLLLGRDGALTGLRQNLELVRDRGMKALIGPHSYDYEWLLATDPQAFHDGGYALRLVLEDFRGTVRGVKVHNEPDLRYRDALRAGEDGSRVVEAYVASTEAFVGGLRAAEAELGLRRMPVYAASMGEPFQEELTGPFYDAFLDMIDRGELDGLDLHLYTSSREYDVVGDGVVRRGLSEAAQVAQLFERLGHARVPLIITEAGCQADTMPTEGHAAACWAAHLRDLASIEGVQLIGPYSVGPDTGPRYLIEPGSVIGDSVAAVVSRFGPQRGSRP